MPDICPKKKSLTVCLQKGLIFMTTAQEGVTTLILPETKKYLLIKLSEQLEQGNSLTEHLKNSNVNSNVN